LKVETTPALQTFTIKAKEIEALATKSILHFCFLDSPPDGKAALFSHLKSQWQELFCHQVCNVRSS
jgi:hypothetical protein